MEIQNRSAVLGEFMRRSLNPLKFVCKRKAYRDFRSGHKHRARLPHKRNESDITYGIVSWEETECLRELSKRPVFC